MTRHTTDSPAPYATSADQHSRRAHAEPIDPLRDAFALDRHRIVESTAFRRLEHKTQVFAPTFGDHIRTRLTHTLEVALIARTLARNLRANETLAEAITLAHDLGHPPFGHAGETALNAIMSDRSGFNHNTHTLRVVEYLEHPFPAFRGLNLTRATLDGLRAHATRYDVPERAFRSTELHSPGPTAPRTTSSVPPAGPDQPVAAENNTVTSASSPSVEAQIASVADRVAYDCHDLEDAIGAGFVSLDELAALPPWQRAYDEHASEHADRSIHAVRRVVLDALLNRVLTDIIEHGRARLAHIATPARAGSWTELPVAPSTAMDRELRVLEDFLRTRVYQHAEVARTDVDGQTMIHRLFDVYLRDPTRLPDRFASRCADQGPHHVICDYIAGMTDRFCAHEHDRLTGR